LTRSPNLLEHGAPTARRAAADAGFTKTECRKFYCAWMVSPSLGEHWRPNKCKMVLRVESGGKLIAVHVDPSDPTAWRREPYFQKLRQFAIDGLKTDQQVIVLHNDRRDSWCRLRLPCWERSR